MSQTYKKSTCSDPPNEEDHLLARSQPSRQSSSVMDDTSVDSDSFLSKLPQYPGAEELSVRLVACGNDEDLEQLVLRRTLDLSGHSFVGSSSPEEDSNMSGSKHLRTYPWSIGYQSFSSSLFESNQRNLLQKLAALIAFAVLGMIVIFVSIEILSLITGPPRLPVGPYTLVELQVCLIFNL